MRARLLPLVVLAAALAPAAAAAGQVRVADRPGDARAAAHIQGHRWPGRHITYWNGSKRNAVYVARAVKAWNASGVRVRFVRAPKGRARVWIRNMPGACVGFAQIGYASGRHADVHLGAPSCGEEDTVLAAHELGHILGLGHEDRRCALMNSLIQLHCAKPRDGWRWRCRIIEADDLHAALRLYGGRARPLHRRFCDRWAAPGAPTHVGFGLDAKGRPVLSWRNSASRHLQEVGIEGYDTCAKATRRLVFADSFAVRPGRTSRHVLTAQYVGPACLVLRSQDTFARGKTATVRATFPNHPPLAAFTSEVLGRADVQFTDASSDDEGEPVAWHWTFGDGAPASSERFPVHRYGRGGSFVVTLVVRDKRGATATVKHTVTVVGALAPTVTFTATVPDTTSDPLGVQTDATASVPRADAWESFTWNWGDGSAAESGWDTGFHEYAASGTYVVRLTAVNSDGGTASATRSVTVHSP